MAESSDKKHLENLEDFEALKKELEILKGSKQIEKVEKKAKPKKEVSLPTNQEGSKTIEIKPTMLPSQTLLTKDGIPQIQNRFKGHTSYTSMIMCKNKKCPCKSM